MRSRLTLRGVVSLAVIALMCCACSGRTEIECILREGVPVFRISACRGSGKEVQVHSIRVYRYDGGARSDRPLCSAMPRDSTMGQARMLHEWTYGQVLDGWDVQGCDRLSPGVYEVHVSATGPGVARFELTADSMLTRLFSLCR